MDTFIGTVTEQGLLRIKNEELMAPYFLPKKGQELEIKVGKAYKRRSNSQNRWYWGVAIRTVIEHFKEREGKDYHPEDIHAYILDQVVKVRFKTKEVMGKTITYVESKSTSSMNTKEFNIFKFELQVYFAQNYGIDIPDPRENNYLNEFEPKKKT